VAKVSDRRGFSRGLAATLGATALAPFFSVAVPASPWVRAGDPGWPDDDLWSQLSQNVGGRLLKLDASEPLPSVGANPFAIRDDPRLTQCAGWTGAWSSQASPYAVAAESSADVAAAVLFARRHRIKGSVKNLGHYAASWSAWWPKRPSSTAALT